MSFAVGLVYAVSSLRFCFLIARPMARILVFLQAMSLYDNAFPVEEFFSSL